MTDVDVRGAARRMKAAKPTDLTYVIAKALHEEGRFSRPWEDALVHDQWLAVERWMKAEAVVRALQGRLVVAA